MTACRTALASLIGLTSAVLALLPGCSAQPDPWEKQPGPPRVVVSIPPLYSFVKQVGGERVGVICLCTKTGPHHYEYNPHDALALRKADLLLGIGLELDEKFLNKLQANSGNANLKYIKLGETKRLKKLVKPPLADAAGGESKEHGDHEHGDKDPHIWLGIDTAKQLVYAIADELKDVDAAHGAEYEKNATAYCQKLDDLQNEYVKQLKNKADRRILPMHDALQYFGDSFGLQIEGAIELTPGDQPTGERYKTLLEKCKKQKIHVIATEPQYEEKVAATLKSELQKKNLDAELVVIDPLETADPNELNADWYVTKMRKNLDTLLDKLP